jgi:hypothetical protein
MKIIRISIDTLSVELSRFTPDGYQRTTPETGATEYSIYGTPLDTGPAYEPKIIWQIATFTTLEQWRTIQTIFSLHDNRRRQQGNYRIAVDDYIRDFVESGTRKRALAAGGIVTSFAGGVSYPAVFYARMLEPSFEITKNGQYPYISRFTLKELDSTQA